MSRGLACGRRCSPDVFARVRRLVQEEIAIAGGGFRILIDGDDDRLDVLIAPAFTRGETARFLCR